VNESTSRNASWNADLYEGAHAFVWRHGAPLVELLAPKRGERILDVGCGTGQLTCAIAEAGASVVGFDKSEDMIVRARRNAPHVDFRVADACDARFDEPFDAVFSNATLHWVKPPERGVTTIVASLRPGGRFVAEFGGAGNVRSVCGALVDALDAAGVRDAASRVPWYFPSVGEYASLLERAGMRVTFAALVDRPTPLEDGERGLASWIAMFGEAFFEGLTARERDDAIARVETALRPSRFDGTTWTLDYVRLRIVAERTR
jgi:trans-aconitate 2-methyltransferase